MGRAVIPPSPPMSVRPMRDHLKFALCVLMALAAAAILKILTGL